MIGTRDKIRDCKSERTRIFDVYEPLSCKKCNKSFKKKAWLKAHVKEHEFDDHTYECKKPDLAKCRPYECEICESKFTAKRNLLKHLRVIHKNFTEAEKLKIRKTRCPESNCMFTCNGMKDLRIHIEKCHNMAIIRDILHFTNEKGFLKWKKEEQENSASSFVSFRREVKLKNGLTKRILQCHRTGQYNPKGTGKHRLKSHGSCKIGGTCPAAMEVSLSPDNGQVTVIYYKTHMGHSQDVTHLPLSREDKAKILERIKQGFTFDTILEDIKESIDPQVGKTKRIHFLSKKDLYNIVQSCNDKKEKTNQGENQELKRNLNIYEQILEPSDAKMSEQLHEKEEMRDSNFMNSEKTNIIELSNIQNKSLAMNSKGVSQQILVSPNVSYISIPKVILLQQTQTINPVVAKPCNKTLVLVPEDERKTKKENELSSENPKNTLLKSSLGQKLKEKVEKLMEFLPKSEFLTIKQYENVNGKLDSIINVFNSVRVKTKSKNLSFKRKGREKGKDEKTSNKTLKLGETTASAPQNVEQHVFQAPVYTYIWNCN